MSDAACDLVEVRLLGQLSVRRADGSVVERSEWRTQKTSDLLRILALQVGQRVPVSELLDTLWPGSNTAKARASLRTAASQIRRVLRSECLERIDNTLVLRGPWVDAQTFTTLARECRVAFGEGRNADAVAAARQADALYLNDLAVGVGDAADWLDAAREALRHTHAGVMDEAAAAAASLGWMRDAADFAERVIAVQPYTERAYRSAMLAYAGLGEVERAFGVYELCRSRLVKELGVDPSPQTQAVQLQLLRVAMPREIHPRLVGREAELARLRQGIAKLAANGGGCIVVTGGARAGTSRLLDETAAQLGDKVRRCDGAIDLSVAIEGGVLIVDDADTLSGAEIRRLATELREQQASNVVIAAQRTGTASAVVDLQTLVTDGLVEWLPLQPLGPLEVHALTETLISGPPTEELIDAVLLASGGEAGVLVDTVTNWLAEGRLIHTGSGLDLCTPDLVVGDSAGTAHQQAQLRERLLPDEQAVLEVMAVIATAVTPRDISMVLSNDAQPDDLDRAGPEARVAEVARVVSMLEDFAIVTVDAAGRFSVRSPLLRDAVRAWMRPAAQRHLHRRIAERLDLPPHSRVRHLTEAGEPDLARIEGTEAAARAMVDKDFATAHQLLLTVENLLDGHSDSPADRLEVMHRLGVCCDHLELNKQADATRARAVSLAALHGLEWPPDAVHHAPMVSLRVADSTRLPLRSRLGLTPGTAPTPEAESLLRDALRLAQHEGDEVGECEARLQLAGLVLVPTRRFAEARRLLQGTRTTLTRETEALTLLTLQEGYVLVGGPSIDLECLARVAELSPGVRSLGCGLPTVVLNALAMHHLGAAGADEALRQATVAAQSRHADGTWRWAVASVMVERGEIEAAGGLTEGAPWRIGSPTAQVLALLGKSKLCFATGDAEGGAVCLLRGVDIAQRTGATLLLPVMASRLVISSEDLDHDSAVGYLDLAEHALGEAVWARERVTFLLARATVRALGGRHSAAAEVARQAEQLATSLGLRFAAQEAAERRAGFLNMATQQAVAS